MLKKADRVFGVTVSTLIKQGRRYRIGLAIGIGIDVLIMTLLVCKVLFSETNTVGQAPVYIIVCICAALFANMAVATSAKSEVKEAYKFYTRFKKSTVHERRYSVTDENLFSILFCTGYQRVKPGMSYDAYIECMNNACCQSLKFSKRIMKYLKQYEDKEDGNMEVKVLRRGKTLYYVDVVSVLPKAKEIVSDTESEESED